MRGITIKFKNRPNEDGTVSSFSIDDCLIAQSGSPATTRPRVILHLPKKDENNVEGAWFDYDSNTYHIVGQAVASIAENTPTRWNRYCIAEKIY